VPASTTRVDPSGSVSVSGCGTMQYSSSWSCSCGIRERPRGKLSLVPIPPPQGTSMPFRFRDDDSSNGTTIASVLLGAMAGFAVGMYVAQRVGGFGGLTGKLRKARGVVRPNLDY